MTGILPDSTNGAKTVRDATGACLSPSGVSNAYCPPSTFTSTCELTALPSDCTARITPAQINALVSEMLCLAATMTPAGTWTCTSTCNLANAFTSWDSDNGNADGTTITGDGTTANPYAVSAGGLADALCASTPAKQTLSLCLLSTDTDNAIGTGTDGLMAVKGTDLAATICASTVSKTTLANCLLSTDANNSLALGTDNLLFGGGGVKSWTTATRPSPAIAGTVGFNTTTGMEEYYNGTSWVQIGGAEAITVSLTADFALPAKDVRYTVTGFAGTNTETMTATTNGVTISQSGTYVLSATTYTRTFPTAPGNFYAAGYIQVNGVPVTDATISAYSPVGVGVELNGSEASSVTVHLNAGDVVGMGALYGSWGVGGTALVPAMTHGGLAATKLTVQRIS